MQSISFYLQYIEENKSLINSHTRKDGAFLFTAKLGF